MSLTQSKQASNICSCIRGITDPDLLRQIGDVLRDQWKVVESRGVRGLFVGDKVRWSVRGCIHEGTIAKVNRKTVHVIENNVSKSKWRVSAAFITLIDKFQDAA